MYPAKARQLALMWLRQGVVPLPVRFRTKKALLYWKQYTTTAPSPARVQAWFTAPPQRYNLGLVMGPISGNLAVLDFDLGEDTFRDWLLQHSEFNDHYQVQTRRGVHVYARVRQWPDSTTVLPRLARGYDLKMSGLVVAAGSTHSLGHEYTTRVAGAIAEVDSIPAFIAGVPVIPHLFHTPYTNHQRPRQELQGSGPAWWIRRHLLPTTVLSLFQNAAETRIGRALETASEGWYVYVCPFHDDHTPSGWINNETGRYGCFVPTCPAFTGGSVIDLYINLSLVLEKTVVTPASAITFLSTLVP